MIVVEPFEGERINVTWDELDSINAVVDASAGMYSKPSFIKDLFWAARGNNRKRKVYLRSEGWHQYEPYKGHTINTSHCIIRAGRTIYIRKYSQIWRR